MPEVALDRIDLRILEVLQEEGRISNVALAERVSLSPTPCLRRVSHLEKTGVIVGYGAEVDRRALGLGVTAFVHINIDKHGPAVTREFLAAVDAIDEIISCHALTGRYDYLLEIVTGTVDDYSNVMMERVGGLPHVSAIQTSFALRSPKRGKRLPLMQLGLGNNRRVVPQPTERNLVRERRRRDP